MWINNIRIFPSKELSSIEIADGLIMQCSQSSFGGEGIDGKGGMLSPGLINSHEHLDFDLYYMMGSPPYEDYRAWATDLHANHKAEIESVERIPRRLREMWGVVRNILHGVTGIINHGSALQSNLFPITVVDHFQDLHSVGFEKNWKFKLNDPRRFGIPCVIHTGEGRSEAAYQEISQLMRHNYFLKKIIAVHGVAMDAIQAKHFEALVWCPATNEFMLHAQPDIPGLKMHTQILFGTDSTLTSPWNIRHHLRFARSLDLLTDDELYRSCTTVPAHVWNMNAGKISPGREANLIISRSGTSSNPADEFFAIDPENIELVMHKGEIVLSDAQLHANHLMQISFPLEYGGRQFYSVIDIQALRMEMLTYNAKICFATELSDQQILM